MRRYTFPSTAVVLVLAGSVAIGTEQGNQARRKQSARAKANAEASAPLTRPDDWPPRFVQIDRLTVEVQGRRITLHDFEAEPNLVKPEPPFPFYRVASEDGDRNFPMPGGAPDVRAVIEREKPIPADRIAYFKPLDNDPLSNRYPRGGWWVYVRRVERHEVGWTAEIMANVWFDHNRNVNGGLPMGRCRQYWIERYRYDGATLTYLGGQPRRPGEVPRIVESGLQPIDREQVGASRFPPAFGPGAD